MTTKNIIKMKGIGNLPIYSRNWSGMKGPDFRKIIPVPKELGAQPELPVPDAVVCFMTDRLTADIGNMPPKVVERVRRMTAPEKEMGPAAAAKWLKSRCEEIRASGRDVGALTEYGRACVDNLVRYDSMTAEDWKTRRWGSPDGPHDCTVTPDEVRFTTEGNGVLPIAREISRMCPDTELAYYARSGNSGAWTETVMKGGFLVRQERKVRKA